MFNLISSMSSVDHTWLQLIPCLLHGWGKAKKRHFFLMEEGGGEGGEARDKSADVEVGQRGQLEKHP